ncbi:MAG: hypothetical protein M3Z14_03250 [Candidatus Eremiobacteraeota bacterium]|nr:hypothetical protein [Candidatus Eremiobacteraeota bacterium]
MVLEVRLVQLIASLISVRSEYTLARLEFSLHFPKLQAPPILSRFIDASEETLRTQWDRVELEVESAQAYVKRIQGRTGICAQNDAAFAWLERNTKELDQYVRAVRWVLTVTERGTA